jgi:D-serine deaminase-like pyridoxal phosphate-dependent protein
MEAMRQLMEAVTHVGNHAIPVPEVSGGGTLTYDISGVYPGITEIQAGSYALMDTNFRSAGSPFACAMSVLATVISRPREGTVIADAGMKSVSTDFGLPETKSLPDATIQKLSEEHTVLAVAPGMKLGIGDTFEILPSHGCTTINLHDVAYVVRQGQVVDVWQITGRGKSQ